MKVWRKGGGMLSFEQHKCTPIFCSTAKKNILESRGGREQ